MGNDCSQVSIEQCGKTSGCKKEVVRCDYVPKGKSFEDVCPHGGKYFVCRENNEIKFSESSKNQDRKNGNFEKYKKEQIIMLEARFKARLIDRDEYKKNLIKINQAKSYDELLKLNTGTPK